MATEDTESTEPDQSKTSETIANKFSKSIRGSPAYLYFSVTSVFELCGLCDKSPDEFPFSHE